ncbi:MAG: efflux RND transporter periplasmic adaptor subunit [Rhizobiales bacterium]|nr:efflux RND transporter periplasmic adaptor subunit [Hyphomicrobiales bacterium]
MRVWKQLILCAVVLAIAVAAWIAFVPASREFLASWGLEWAVAAVPASGAKPDAAENNAGRAPQAVVALPVERATINDRLHAIGTGRAKATVAVTPYAAGRITRFLVGSGSRVGAGDEIARLDSDTEEIAVERTRIARDDAVAKVERARALRKSSAITQVQLTEAELGLRNAELAVHEAELALARRAVTAPISGVVGILPIEAGNYVTTQSTVATIDDRSSILVDFWVPERFAASVGIGMKIEASTLADAGKHFEGSVSAIDNRVDEKSRTLWVQATIANPADSLRAGMSFDITMKFPGDTYPAVSPLAIQWDTEGAFVWTVDGGKARRVPVRIIQRNSQTVLVDAAFGEGAMVVTEGVQNIREGDDVLVAGSQAPAA